MEHLSEKTLIDIVAHVASDSLSDLFSLKLSCKSFNRLADSPKVYKRATLRKYSMLSWHAMAREGHRFLKKCLQYRNPEMLYKQGLTRYYRDGYVGEGDTSCYDAAKLGWDEARFAVSVVRLFSGSLSTEEEAARYLLSRLRVPSDRERMLVYRENLLSIFDWCSFACPLLEYRPSNRCKLWAHYRPHKDDLDYLEGIYTISDLLEEEDEFPDCPECNLDMIIKRFYFTLNWEFL